jgi:hypothetical protein
MKPYHLAFFSVLIFLLFSQLARAETRYMTSWYGTVNGLSANYLSTSQSSSSQYCSVAATTNATFGIRVWKRSSTGSEVEITQGTPVATVTRSSGEGLQNSTWLCPETKLSRNDSIVVRVYISPDGGDWVECRNFTTEQLENVEILNSSQWSVYYYTYRRSWFWGSYARVYYGSPTYNSRIINFSYTTRVFLQPAEASFNITAIYIPKGEINITGNSTYLNIYFEAYYSDGSQRDIGAVCFLNCDLGYEACSSAGAQNCSVLIPPGRGGCSILNPQYNFPLNTSNNVSCTFYDPMNRELTIGVGYLNSTFIPVKFSSWFSNYSSLVGEEFNLPVNVENSGLFSDTYRVQAWTNSPEKVYINPATQDFSIQLHGDAFDPHAWTQTGQETKQVYIRVVLLDASDEHSNLCVNVSSSVEPTIYHSNCVTLRAKFKSVPELDLAQILLIMLLATIFIFKFKKKFKGL